MNVALLNDYDIDIEKEAQALVSQGHDREYVKKQLNERYRKFSRKGAFRCVCCNERVEMVLVQDKTYHFRHSDKEGCSYSNNQQTYTRQKESVEDMPKHRAGKAILRTYLEGVCKLNDIRLTDGYRFKSTLSFVPDFILEFPNGQRWAIDYLTGLKHNKKYANSLQKRKDSYKKHHFVPIFLVDSYWLAYESTINHVSLVEGELLCISQTEQDGLWTDYINNLESNLKNALFNNRPYKLQVKSIPYINPHEREIHIIRFLQEINHPTRTRTVCKPIKIPLEQALAINDNHCDFTYTSRNEDAYREALKNQLTSIYQEQLQDELIRKKQQEVERIQKEEAEKKQRELSREKEEKLQQEAAQRARQTEEDIKGTPFKGRSKWQMDQELKSDMRALHSKESSKNSSWYRETVKHMLKSSEEESGIKQLNMEEGHHKKIEHTISSKMPAWKEKELLYHSVSGEAYFSGSPEQWKRIILDSYNHIYTNKISAIQLLQKIKDKGIKWDQPEKIMLLPVKEYMNYISMKMKNIK
ncbi:MAG: hypothetical protein ABF649_20610 [Bacillus sp. (in: firmicutes)]